MVIDTVAVAWTARLASRCWMVKTVATIALVGVPEIEPVAESMSRPVAVVRSGLVAYVMPVPVGKPVVGPAWERSRLR
jgi:hypothetical protein